MLSTEQERARVLVLLTDGTDVSSTELSRRPSSPPRARRACSSTRSASPRPADARAALERLATATGGTYHDAASTSALKSVYASIAAELKRTWRLEYVTAARPGDKLHVRVALDPEGAASADAVVPGTLAPAPVDSHALPDPLYTPLGGLLLTLSSPSSS